MGQLISVLYNEKCPPGTGGQRCKLLESMLLRLAKPMDGQMDPESIG